MTVSATVADAVGFPHCSRCGHYQTTAPDNAFGWCEKCEESVRRYGPDPQPAPAPPLPYYPPQPYVAPYPPSWWTSPVITFGGPWGTQPGTQMATLPVSYQAQTDVNVPNSSTAPPLPRRPSKPDHVRL